MARDPPRIPSSLDTSPNLHDLPLEQPSAVVKARPTIIHPQLRDLILPLERGRVLYPRGNSIEDLSWTTTEKDDEDDMGMDLDVGVDGDKPRSSIRDTSRTLVKLNFTPNCLVANFFALSSTATLSQPSLVPFVHIHVPVCSKQILAAGGQHGELYITNLPRLSPDPLDRRFAPRKLRPFQITQTLSSRSINNSMILLPSYPAEWGVQSKENRIGAKRKLRYGAREQFPLEPMHWPEEKEEDNDMDIEEEDEEGEEEVEPSSPLTYPNTVPFLHAPRIPGLASPSPPWRHEELGREEAGPSRRAVSFSEWNSRPPRSDTTRLARQSFSIPRPGMPPVEYVTSYPNSPQTSSLDGRVPPRQRDRRSSQRDPTSKKARVDEIPDEPRLLISNNDLTIKMFSLRPSSSSTTPAPAPSAVNSRTPIQPIHSHGRHMPLPMPIPRSSSNRIGWDSPTTRENLNGRMIELEQEIRSWGDISSIDSTMSSSISSGQGQGYRHRHGHGQGHGSQIEEFERMIQMRVNSNSNSNPNSNTDRSVRSEESFWPIQRSRPRQVVQGPSQQPPGLIPTGDRKLFRIGDHHFKCAINHSSLSPDLKNMVCVGDSEDVHLFEVIDGGREFKQITTYKGATDAGFSTAWSRDGRKFAVAAQDGQVTVWDHRSSHPLAKFFSSTGPHRPSLPTFSSDIMSSPTATSGPILVDPVTGDPRLGSSTSGREAARVVKFSPEGASRDLLVFSEENSNIHMIDAQTLNSHLILPVPSSPSPNSSPSLVQGLQGQRQGMEGGTWGIAGISFDPTGEFLYSGTERTVVEWDLRGGRGGGGDWDLA